MAHRVATLFLAILVFSLLAFFSCDDEITPVKPEPDGVEGEIAVAITGPENGALLDEATVVLVDVVSDFEIEYVDLLIDRVPVFRVTERPYDFLWFVGFWAQEREHTLQAKAVDVNGKLVLSKAIEVEIDPSTLAKPIASDPDAIVCCYNVADHQLKWCRVEGAEYYSVVMWRPEWEYYMILNYHCDATCCSSEMIDFSCNGIDYLEYNWSVHAMNSGRWVGSDINSLTITSNCQQ